MFAFIRISHNFSKIFNITLWSGSDFYSSHALIFSSFVGYADDYNKSNQFFYAWAVRPCDVADNSPAGLVAQSTAPQAAQTVVLPNP